MTKDKNLHLRLSEETYNTIKEHCDKHNVNQSEYIRELIEKDKQEMTLEERIESLEYTIGELESSIDSLKKKMPDNTQGIM